MSSPIPRRSLEPSDELGIFRPPLNPWRVVGIALAMFVLQVGVGLSLTPGFDLRVAVAMNSLHTGWIGALCSAIYQIFEPLPSIAMTAVLAGVIWKVCNLLTAVAFAGVVALTWIPSELIKVIVQRGRPDIEALPYPFYPPQTDASFPSGHTAFIVALVIALAYVATGTRWHHVVVTVGTILTACVALALSIDAVHYPTDILASVAWSLAMAPAARMVWVDRVLPRVPGLAPRGTSGGPGTRLIA
ncbi:MAG: phosphatase PAP2 family protein [Propionibacteriaceae bacterium]|nr:phosphatase PAP2 family protein [Micropruina sp.]